MVAAIIRGRVHKLIRVRELAASHRLEQMRSVKMLEKRATWMRENGFDRIKVFAEMHEETLRRLPVGLHLKPFYTGLYNPRRPPTPDQYTVNMKLEVETLRLEILLSQPLTPPQFDISPRRSPAAGTGFNKPRVPHTEMQHMEQEGTFLFRPVSMTFCALIA